MEIFALNEEYAKHYLNTLENATPEQMTAAFNEYGDQPLPNILTYNEDNTEAVITITGPMSAAGPGPLARFLGFGGTAYVDIIAAIKKIESNSAIETVRLIMNTPGGTVDGMSQAAQAINSLSNEKMVVAENHGMIASAGYFLAANATKIIAMSELAQTGSIGIILAGLDYSEAMAKNGVKKFAIISSNAPNKQADPTTSEGRKVWQNMIDANERVFIQNIAIGRNTTAQDVIDNFGKGGMLIAKDPDPKMPDALKTGMIDDVMTGSTIQNINENTPINAGPTVFKDFPIVDRPWDSSAADKRVRNFVNATDKPNSRYSQAFFWFDATNVENFGAYKLPFVDIVNGKMTAILNGIHAANGSMAGARGQRVKIPNADRARVQSHIDRYLSKWEKQKGKTSAIVEDQENDDSVIFEPIADNNGNQQEGVEMDLTKLKAEHPTLFAEAVNIGVKRERDRVSAHLTMAEASGDMDLAVQCINDGENLTPAVNAKHMAATMKKQAIAARGSEAEDDLDTDLNDDDVSASEAELAVALAEQLGVDINE